MKLDVVDILPERLLELEQQREELQRLILEAQAQIEQAKAHQKATGEYMEAKSFADLRLTIRENTTKLHDINRNIKDLHRQLSKSNPKAAFFQQAAKKLLAPNKYEEVNELANRWMKRK
jgi:DNA repair exonuclease SbcCD ATPase subunit